MWPTEGDEAWKGEDFERFGLEVEFKVGLPDTGKAGPESPLLLGAKTGAVESGEGRFIELRR